jgi:hypothetical protein
VPGAANLMFEFGREAAVAGISMTRAQELIDFLKTRNLEKNGLFAVPGHAI